MSTKSDNNITNPTQGLTDSKGYGDQKSSNTQKIEKWDVFIQEPQFQELSQCIRYGTRKIVQVEIQAD